MNVLELRAGKVFQYDGRIYIVQEAVHTHQQQRRGLVRCKARELATGKMVEHVFRSNVDVEEIYIEELPLTYQYRDGSSFYFMNEETYEQVAIPSKIVGEKEKFLRENGTVTGLVFDGAIRDISLPLWVDLAVIETEPGFKGDTVSGAKKRAVVETGLTVQVPLFIEVGDVIRVDTRTGEYITRAGSDDS